MATLRLTRVNVLKAKDRCGMGVPARSRAVASAPVVRKGSPLRSARWRGSLRSALTAASAAAVLQL
jgi:hypothetical protein